MKLKLLLYLFATGSVAAAQTRPAATLIVTNANVYTVDKQHPKADAVAAIGDRIVAVGSSAEIDLWRGPDTKVIDAGGKLLLPGFDDSHVHFISGGAQLDQVELNDATTPEEFARRIGAQTKKTAKGEWIVGGDWDETKWPKPQLPTKELVDAVTGNTPIFVNRYDGHQSLANTAALKLAGITAKTPDVAGGVIVRDKSGNPTGIFKDAAMDLINKAIPPMSHERRMRAARRALEHAASVGVTSVQDMNPEFADVAVYSELAEKGELTTRIYAAPMETNWQDQAKVGLRHAWGSSYLRLGAVKGYADGSLGSGTAYMYQPFSDEPGNRGLLSDEMHPPAGMRARLMKADAAGLQLRVHAIGDHGIAMILDIFSDIEKEHGYHDQRFSFCCAVNGCRGRETPASLRFLGRRVYVAAIVVLIAILKHGATDARLARLSDVVSVDRRTIARWRHWWRDAFTATPFWRIARARFMPPVDHDRLPAALIERFTGDSAEPLIALLRFLAPITGGAAMQAR